jgi:hypothetical protein
MVYSHPTREATRLGRTMPIPIGRTLFLVCLWGMHAVILPGNTDKRPTISAQYLRRLYASPAPELDLGTFVQSATILLSGHLGGFMET